MSLLELLTAVAVIFVFIYLLWALLRPEDFRSMPASDIALLIVFGIDVLVAKARGMSEVDVRAAVVRHTQQPFLGFLGAARVNVLEVNLDLDGLLQAGA